MSEKYTLERVYQVFDNANGAKISVKPDVDGLGLIEVDGGDDYGRIVFDPELAGIVAHAILHCCDDIAHFQKKVEEKLKARGSEAVKVEAPVADDEGWTLYNGGGNPFSERIEIIAKLRSGYITNTEASGRLDWDIDGTEGDIVAYRLSEESEAL